MFHSERPPDFADFLIRLLSGKQVVGGKDYRSQVS